MSSTNIRPTKSTTASAGTNSLFYLSGNEKLNNKIKHLPNGDFEVIYCNPHPDAPHGFNRNASHTEDRYVCECESWIPEDKSLQDYMKQAQELWNDSCTAPRKK